MRSQDAEGHNIPFGASKGSSEKRRSKLGQMLLGFIACIASTSLIVHLSFASKISRQYIDPGGFESHPDLRNFAMNSSSLSTAETKALEQKKRLLEAGVRSAQKALGMQTEQKKQLEIDIRAAQEVLEALRARKSNEEKHSGSAKREVELPPVPKFVIDPIFKAEQDKIDNAMNDKTRCLQYGVGELGAKMKARRRIFFGSMLADDNLEVLQAQTIEVFNMYDVVALAESNTTFKGTPRTMNYGPGSLNARKLLESEMFGTPEHTTVAIDYWMEDLPGLIGMDRELEQRSTLLKIWLDQGMTKYDIGLFADIDEILSRDFLHALRVCDFPKLRYDKNPTCQEPGLNTATISFESSPKCIRKSNWYHPDIFPGHCIQGIGNPVGRVTPERSKSLRQAKGLPEQDGAAKIFGERKKRWGRDSIWEYPDDIKANNRFPLWDARDFRRVASSTGPLLNYVPEKRPGHGSTALYGTAYHLHNWFQDSRTVRNKYHTYGHFNQRALEQPFASLSEDLAMTARCIHNIGNTWTTDDGQKIPVIHRHQVFFENVTILPETAAEGPNQGWVSLAGNRPIYFLNRTYVVERHALVTNMFLAEEATYGRAFQNTTDYRTLINYTILH